jgi:hypothetical protein
LIQYDVGLKCCFERNLRNANYAFKQTNVEKVVLHISHICHRNICLQKYSTWTQNYFASKLVTSALTSAATSIFLGSG